MTPKERHIFNCSEVFNFKKGTEKFNDCVFKLYTAELDLQKLELEKELAEAKIKVAAPEQARAEAVAKAQIAAAKSARRSSDLNNSIQLMRLGSSMLGGSTSSSSSLPLHYFNMLDGVVIHSQVERFGCGSGGGKQTTTTCA